MNSEHATLPVPYHIRPFMNGFQSTLPAFELNQREELSQ